MAIKAVIVLDKDVKYVSELRIKRQHDVLAYKVIPTNLHKYLRYRSS